MCKSIWVLLVLVTSIVSAQAVVSTGYEVDDFEIDAVYTWAAEPDYDTVVQTCSEWERKSGNKTQPVLKQRFRDMNMLKYSLRSISAFMPWLRNIFVVTDGARPDYIRADVPKLKFITHREIWDAALSAEDLPTYNSEAIEVHLHRIPGLSEHFIYFNDDCLIGKPLSKDKFFHMALGCIQTPYWANTHVPHPMRVSCMENAWRQHSDLFRSVGHTRCRMEQTEAPFRKAREWCREGNCMVNLLGVEVFYVSHECSASANYECFEHKVPEILAQLGKKSYDFISVNDNLTEDPSAFASQNQTINEALHQFYQNTRELRARQGHGRARHLLFEDARVQDTIAREVRATRSWAPVFEALFPEPSEFEVATGYGAEP